jgi:hypothetical protein
VVSVSPGKAVTDRDVCPDTGLARPSYGQARALLDTATAADGRGTGWDLHELRHSGLTHPGEAGASGDRDQESTESSDQRPPAPPGSRHRARHSRCQPDTAGSGDMPRLIEEGHVPPGGVTPFAGGSAVCIMPS